MSDRLAEIRAYVAQHTGGAELADDTDIFATGHVNSLFAVQVVVWVEQRYGVEVSGQDLDIANFRTIGHIDEFVTRKMPTVAP